MPFYSLSNWTCFRGRVSSDPSGVVLRAGCWRAVAIATHGRHRACFSVSVSARGLAGAARVLVWQVARHAICRPATASASVPIAGLIRAQRYTATRTVLRPRRDAGSQRPSFSCQRRRGAMAWLESQPPPKKRGAMPGPDSWVAGADAALVALDPGTRHGDLAGVRRAAPRSHRRPRSRVGRRETPATGWWRRIGPSGAAPRYRCPTATGHRSRSCRGRAGCAAA